LYLGSFNICPSISELFLRVLRVNMNTMHVFQTKSRLHNTSTSHRCDMHMQCSNL